MGILLILLGIIGVIINANGWLIIPQLVINILFILGGFITLCNILLIHKTNNRINKSFKREIF